MINHFCKFLALATVICALPACDSNNRGNSDNDDDNERSGKVKRSEYERMLAEQGYSTDNPVLIGEEEVAAVPELTELKIVEEVEKAKEPVKVAAPAKTEVQAAAEKNLEAIKKEIVEEAPAPASETPKDEGPVSLAMVEMKPQFSGGEAAMYKWLAEHISYPLDAAEQGIEGRVIVQMVVEKDGSISNVKVIRGKHPSLDKEAMRVVMAMPKWIPGRNNGQVVRVTYLLPITFKLQ